MVSKSCLTSGMLFREYQKDGDQESFNLCFAVHAVQSLNNLKYHTALLGDIGNNCFCLTLQVSSYLVWTVFNKIVNTDPIHYELKSSIWSVSVTVTTMLWAWFWTFILLSSHIISVGFLLEMRKSCDWNSAFNKQTRTSALLSLWCVEHCAQLPSQAPLRMLPLSEAQGLSVQRQAKFIKISYKTTVWWSILLHCGWFSLIVGRLVEISPANPSFQT